MQAAQVDALGLPGSRPRAPVPLPSRQRRGAGCLGPVERGRSRHALRLTERTPGRASAMPGSDESRVGHPERVAPRRGPPEGCATSHVDPNSRPGGDVPQLQRPIRLGRTSAARCQAWDPQGWGRSVGFWRAEGRLRGSNLRTTTARMPGTAPATMIAGTATEPALGAAQPRGDLEVLLSGPVHIAGYP